jgi:DNA adenine methylase
MPKMTETRPTRPLAAYVGGKRLLARTIIERINAIEHETYVEPFVGMGGVFLRRSMKPQAEVINDGSGDVATLFRVLQRHYTAFVDMIRWQLTSRREFERLAATDPATLTDLERSARFIYLQKTGFGGKVAGRTFGVSPRETASFDVTKIVSMLEAVHERLASVTIENLDFEQCLARYDRPGTMFYLDPPYWGSEGYYGKELFSRADFERLAAALSRLEGTFILSLNDCEGVRATFKSFRIEAVTTRYCVGGGASSKEAGEVLIMGGRSFLKKMPFDLARDAI